MWGKDPRRTDRTKPADSLDHLNAVANQQPPVRSVHQDSINNRGGEHEKAEELALWPHRFHRSENEHRRSCHRDHPQHVVS